MHVEQSPVNFSKFAQVYSMIFYMSDVKITNLVTRSYCDVTLAAHSKLSIWSMDTLFESDLTKQRLLTLEPDKSLCTVSVYMILDPQEE